MRGKGEAAGGEICRINSIASLAVLPIRNPVSPGRFGPRLSEIEPHFGPLENDILRHRATKYPQRLTQWKPCSFIFALRIGSGVL
jgi:hypothetical protein